MPTYDEPVIDSRWIKQQWKMHVEKAKHAIAAGVLGEEMLEISRFNTAASLHIALAAEIRAMLVEEF